VKKTYQNSLLYNHSIYTAITAGLVSVISVAALKSLPFKQIKSVAQNNKMADVKVATYFDYEINRPD